MCQQTRRSLLGDRPGRWTIGPVDPRAQHQRVAQRELAPKATKWDAKGAFAPGVLEGMGQLGLMGMCVPEKWGGAGADFTSYSLAMEEIAAGWAAASSVMSVNNSPMCSAVMEWGSDDQKERFLRPLAQGAIGCFCLTEPHAGSDAGS